MIYLIAGYAVSRSMFAKESDVVSHFAVENLQKEQLREAWLVVRTSGLEANMDWWVTDATELIDRGGGVLAARAPDGGIHGVATYIVVGKLPFTRVLAVEILITFELNRSAPAGRALLEALEQVAAARNCAAVAMTLSDKAA